MSVSYEYYKIFYYVATYHSFNKAAAVLSNSQPNISRSIANLESQLGYKLFNRSSAGVTLTEPGEELYNHVKIAYRHLSEGEKIARSVADAEGGFLKIGISIDLTKSILSKIIIPAINSFRIRYPAADIEICHDATPKLAEEAGNHLLDIAFITTPFDEKEKMHKYHKKILDSYNDIIIAGMAFAELKDKNISLPELTKYPLICMKNGTETYEFYKHVFAGYSLSFNPSIEVYGMDQVLLYTIENLGIGVIHPEDAAKALKEGLIFRVNVDNAANRRYVALLRSTSEKKAAIDFEKVVNEYTR